ncbi:HNH endonuclease signature motif containing protein [Rhizobium hidalgonense]|uniref:HNH endonuclease signature motif containing protein n=1 Tax=Rhizobium hidalgonense TaxID=1538159 RepID=A0AAJ2H0F6_9HYPH|nr:HNH endonuclease signature motif containing protein [Rhizobium hidalgonense]MDR9777250.1 HNH endonuclease signature motif containing protein [Rhizobium hidalgonense]
MNRMEFSRKTKAAIIARAAGKCEACSAVLKPGEGEVDHILPCALGGEPTVANGRLICRVCHVEKTANDIRSIRKADRSRDKASGAIAPKQKIRSPGFPVSEKAARRQAKPPLPPRQLFAPAAIINQHTEGK